MPTLLTSEFGNGPCPNKHYLAQFRHIPYMGQDGSRQQDTCLWDEQPWVQVLVWLLTVNTSGLVQALAVEPYLTDNCSMIQYPSTQAAASILACIACMYTHRVWHALQGCALRLARTCAMEAMTRACSGVLPATGLARPQPLATAATSAVMLPACEQPV